jgi:hypothetical protein
MPPEWYITLRNAIRPGHDFRVAATVEVPRGTADALTRGGIYCGCSRAWIVAT